MPSVLHPSYQALSPEEKRVTTLLAPLLRLADALDRNHDQRLKGLECRIREAEVIFELESDRDIDLEQWAAERVGETFTEVYQKRICLVRAKA